MCSMQKRKRIWDNENRQLLQGFADKGRKVSEEGMTEKM